MKIKSFISATALLFSGMVRGQYAPSAGQAGTSAMHMDSSAFVNWCNAAKIIRGLQDISNPGSGAASAGDSTMATGKAQSNPIVSLGDGGQAICTFPKSIRNGNGPDFAVFENGFDDTFLELGFVEVSSDGVNYFRFRSHSLTDTSTQTGSFGPTTATKINNLAGKYRGGYGTPFDLDELKNKPGLDINAVTHVKIVDVVGSINLYYASRDGYGNKVNDPWPTPFPSSGFDLDAVGVINENNFTGLNEEESLWETTIFPNPVQRHEEIKIHAAAFISAELFDIAGKSVVQNLGPQISIQDVLPGFYFLKVRTASGHSLHKVLVL